MNANLPFNKIRTACALMAFMCAVQALALPLALVLPFPLLIPIPAFAQTTKAADQLLSRRMVFPQQFSLGKLYAYTSHKKNRLMEEPQKVSHGAGTFIGDAKGVVTVPVEKNTFIYLIPSYDLLAHPEVLTKLDPNTIDCLSFSNEGLMVSIDKAIEPLSRLTGLRMVEINVAELTDAQVMPLKKLVNLYELKLVGNSLHGDCFKEFAGMTQLKKLDLTVNPLSRAAFAYLSQFKNLENLTVNQCGVTDSDMVQITKLQNLGQLGINQASVTVKGLELVKNLSKLHHFSVLGTKLSMQDMTVLKGMSLRSIDLPRRKYSPADLKLFRETFPSVRMGQPSVEPLTDDTKMIFSPLH